jgi:8-oxo-dGTP pyrophosphatase MutT (NUDIX family)
MAFSLTRVAVIVIKNNQILLIHRFRKGKDFWVIPGGSVEEGESLEEAGKREIKEETNLDVEIGEKLWEYENDYYGDGIRKEYYFLAKNFSDGEVRMTGEELERASEQNQFHPEWVSLAKIKDLNLKPEFAKEKILLSFRD